MFTMPYTVAKPAILHCKAARISAQFGPSGHAIRQVFNSRVPQLAMCLVFSCLPDWMAFVAFFYKMLSPH